VRRFTKAEVALARRIKEKTDADRWIEAEKMRTEPLQDSLKRIMDAPMQPSYGPTPPWWEQAVAEEDQDLLWVSGYGWMKRDLWEDILKCSEELNHGA
jgi:hypothetical protein